MSKIILKDIKKEYCSDETRITALDNINFEIGSGELVVILGASGAGKSTLLNILGGMDIPTSGKYLVDDVDVTALNEKKLSLFRREKIGFVFQFYNLMPNLTALENVELSAQTVKNGLDPIETLKMVGLEKRINNFPSKLSGGEQQRVSIARAIVKQPSLLLCDEPTGALDSKTGQSIIKLLKEISKNGNQTVIIVTHNANIQYMADRVIKLSDGKIIEDVRNDTPKDVEEIVW